jgi:hypothetical protein
MIEATNSLETSVITYETTWYHNAEKRNPIFHGREFIIIIYWTANGSLPGGSGNTIRRNPQNNPPRSNKAQHTKLHNNKQNQTTVIYYTQ